jgi:hypothetical protein
MLGFGVQALLQMRKGAFLTPFLRMIYIIQLGIV